MPLRDRLIQRNRPGRVGMPTPSAATTDEGTAGEPGGPPVYSPSPTRIRSCRPCWGTKLVCSSTIRTW
jgi:hypothetical protein